MHRKTKSRPESVASLSRHRNTQAGRWPCSLPKGGKKLQKFEVASLNYRLFPLLLSKK